MPIDVWTSSTPATWSSWHLDSMHGEEVDRANDLMHLGARHLALRDGIWLQPEPLLHQSPLAGGLAMPLGYSSLYAAGDSNRQADRSGAWPTPDTVWDSASLVVGAYSFVDNISKGNYGSAALDGVGVVVDGVALAVPVLPGGMSIGVRAARGGARAADAAATALTKGDDAIDAARAAGNAGCFVEGVEVITAVGSREIERVDTGDRIVAAAASTDEMQEPWVEVEDAPVEESGAWAPRGVCDRVTAWAPKWAMPAMVALAACGVEPELPAVDEVVQVYDARTGDWSEVVGAELEVGDTWLDDGGLRHWTDDGVQDRGDATVEELADADATWTAAAATRMPGTDEWVVVLGEADESGHRKLGAVEAGERFAFQGRVFETADDDEDGLIEVRPTGDVLGRVVNTFVRMAPEVIDADIEYANGTTDTLTGTPNHPFWVDAIRDYVPLGDLKVGTVLHVQGGGEAILVSKTWRQGDFEVFDFEVEGLHNFYVRGPRSDAAGVLVHNSTGGRGPGIPGGGGKGPSGPSGSGGGPGGPGPSGGPDVPASTPVGRLGSPMDVPRGTNTPATIGGRDYSGHALDQMQGRGLTPSVVEDTISRASTPGKAPGTIDHVTEQAQVVTNAKNGTVITVWPRSGK